MADLQDGNAILDDHVGPALPSPHDPSVVVLAVPLHILGACILKLALLPFDNGTLLSAVIFISQCDATCGALKVIALIVPQVVPLDSGRRLPRDGVARL